MSGPSIVRARLVEGSRCNEHGCLEIRIRRRQVMTDLPCSQYHAQRYRDGLKYILFCSCSLIFTSSKNPSTIKVLSIAIRPFRPWIVQLSPCHHSYPPINKSTTPDSRRSNEQTDSQAHM